MNTRLSASTLAYLAQQEKLDEEEIRRKRLEEREQEKTQQQQFEIAKRKEALPYSDAIATEICHRISAGELLIDICKDEGMPFPRLVMRWKALHADFAHLFKLAIGDRLDMFEEQIIQISDDASCDLTANGKPNSTGVVRAKVRIDTRLRHLKAYRPERWGEAVTVKNVDTRDEDLSQLDDAQLEQRIADLERKSASVHGAIVGRDVGCSVGALVPSLSRENTAQLRTGRDLF